MRTSVASRGYTLIELIVSVAIFTVVMLVAGTAFLTLISLDRHTRATNDVVTNLFYVVDSMERSIRTGTEFDCGTVGGATDCWSSPGSQFSFTDADGRDIQYRLTVVSSMGRVEQRINSGSWIVLTDPRVDVESLAFYVRGSSPKSSGDETQPMVVMIVRGTITPDPKSAPVEFVIQSGATQRLIDL